MIQNDVGNRHSPTSIVAAITRTVPPQPYPFVVLLLPHESGLPETSAVNCAQLATIQQADRPHACAHHGRDTPRPIGCLDDAKMAAVDQALLYSLGLG